jgi:hypothetical protein
MQTSHTRRRMTGGITLVLNVRGGTGSFKMESPRGTILTATIRIVCRLKTVVAAI